ncbi:hypothetical protein QC764_0052800 [Podospora pseudoanserina]|uniref:Uncharacterized protein n=1 Tax=Podospora pseudoanserina TaxID=2609844 RepID=A0ABR0ICX4_9PEZI|nr:hypothetical protein QC764_0052800 [Podospora pseudoanserina]
MGSENPEETTIGIAALVAAVAALLFAVIQTITALAQYISAFGSTFPRCRGIRNIECRVLTMPGLRSEPMVTMERDPSNAEFRPGKNYDNKRNGYLDYGVLRVVAGSDRSKVHREVSILPTVLWGVFAVVWTPIAIALSSITLVFCYPPAFACSCACTGCCGMGRPEEEEEEQDKRDRFDWCRRKRSREICLDLLTPLTFAWKWAIKYKSAMGVHLVWRPSRGLSFLSITRLFGGDTPTSGDQNDRGLRREVTGCIQRALEAGGRGGVVVERRGGGGEEGWWWRGGVVVEGSLELVKVVMANTEVVLRGVRRGLGVGDMWVGDHGEGKVWEDDFGGVVLGA